MKLLKFYRDTNALKLKLETLDDLWVAERTIFAGDNVRAISERRFRPSEGAEGELKDVLVTLNIEKTEFDKDASRLRINGKIVDAKPLEYVRLNSYHTINVATGDTIEIIKPEWREYMLNVIRNAVNQTKKPRLGIIVLDDEKALAAYILGYGVEFGNEIYSGLSKRMTQKDFAQQQLKYYEQIIETIERMRVDIVIVAGPGFTKDDLKDYIQKNSKKVTKRLLFKSASDAERTGAYELIKSEEVRELLERERIRVEFKLMEEFLAGLSAGKSHRGVSSINDAIDAYGVQTIMVNDSALDRQDVKQLLARAEDKRISIEVFNSSDEVGMQLHSFDDIASIG